MRIATYSHGNSAPRAGLVVDDGVIDIQRASDGSLPPSVLELLATPNWHGLLLQDVAGGSIHHRTAEIRLLTPIARPGKILAAAGNYQAHIDEGGGTKVDPTIRTPRIFMKPATSLVGPDDPLVLPSVSEQVDWEMELAIVIGHSGRDIPKSEALDHVAGYTIMNDVSARSMSWGVENREVHAWDGFFDWLVGKWIDGFAPTGPWIVTADEIPDPQNLQLTFDLNGERWQDASTAGMIFDCADLISFASRIMTLEPGDMIATGTPAGVGVATGRFLRPGDDMVGEISGIGQLRTPVVAP
jgi:2-keto-4-pentenoate hydratase/2-oxohepta-3-ene-1,7-dioic acid hydratase in catechol pathway